MIPWSSNVKGLNDVATLKLWSHRLFKNLKNQRAFFFYYFFALSLPKTPQQLRQLIQPPSKVSFRSFNANTCCLAAWDMILCRNCVLNPFKRWREFSFLHHQRWLLHKSNDDSSITLQLHSRSAYISQILNEPWSLVYFIQVWIWLDLHVILVMFRIILFILANFF